MASAISRATQLRTRGAMLALKKDLPEELRIKKWKILRGDTVEVIAGRDTGKQGEVLSVIRKLNKVLVSGVNMVKKHVPDQEGRKGGIYQLEAPIHVSKVALLDPKDGKPCKVGFRFLLEDGQLRKVRISRRSGLIIEKPPFLPPDRSKRVDSPKDTPADLVVGKYTPQLAPYMRRPGPERVQAPAGERPTA